MADFQDPPPEVKVRGGGCEAGGGHGGQGDQDDQGRQGGQSGHCGQSAQEIEMMEKDDYQAYLQNGESSAVICDAMLTAVLNEHRIISVQMSLFLASLPT